MIKNRFNTIKYLSNSTKYFFKKYIKTLYNNIIELDKNYKSIYLFSSLISFFINFKLRTF